MILFAECLSIKKNPLSGIRGAAQLLEQAASSEDRMLTRLICDEADRIVTLVDRMEVFGDDRPVARGPVNIHSVLDHVKRLAQSGFARNIRFVEEYDPSLPPVLEMLVMPANSRSQALASTSRRTPSSACSGLAPIGT